MTSYRDEMKEACTRTRTYIENMGELFTEPMATRSVLANSLAYAFNAPQVFLTKITSPGKASIHRTRVGTLSPTLIDMLLDASINDDEEFDAKTTLTRALGLIFTSAAITDSLSETNSAALRWQDVLTQIINDEDSMSVVDAFTVDGEPIADLIVATLVG